MSTLQDGTISGTVTDNQGAPLPGATVTLTGEMPQVQVSNVQGQFRFPDLQPGSYEVKATLEGFTSDTQPASVTQGRTTNVQLTLQPVFE